MRPRASRAVVLILTAALVLQAGGVAPASALEPVVTNLGVEAHRLRALDGGGLLFDDFARRYVWQAATGTLTDIGPYDYRVEVVLKGGRVAFTIMESSVDLNGDGDLLDHVVHVWDPATMALSNLALPWAGNAVALDGGQLALRVPEPGQGARDRNGDRDRVDDVVAVWDPATRTTRNLRFAANDSLTALRGGRLAFEVAEGAQGVDLNGDGDKLDKVLHVWDPVTGGTRNLRLASGNLVPIEGGGLAFLVSESSQGGLDRNGDGDTADRVVHVWGPATNRARNLGLAGDTSGIAGLGGGRAAFLVAETDQGGVDLNGDGDALDRVVHIWDPAAGTIGNLRLAGGRYVGLTAFGQDRLAFKASEPAQGVDLNGDGDASDDVQHVWGPKTSTTNLRLGGYVYPVALPDGSLAVTVYEWAQGRRDLNGDGDVLDHVLHIWGPATGALTSLGLSAGPPLALLGGGIGFVVDERFQGNRDLTGDGDATDSVLHWWNRATGEITNLRLASLGFPVAVSDGWMALAVAEYMQSATDLNGDGDASDPVAFVIPVPPAPEP